MCPVAANADNYTLGRGVVYFDKKISAGVYEGERDLGNAPAFSVALALEKLDHFSSRSGLKAKDKIVVTQITPTVTFTLDEINVENVAMAFMANTTPITQAAQDDLSAIIANGYMGNRYYDLGDFKNVGIWKLEYDGGTGSAPALGEVVSGATGEGTIVGFEAGSDATAGVLFIQTITPGFVNNEVLTGSVALDAFAVGIETWDATQLSVHLTATPATQYDKTDDFTVDSATGRIYVVAGGAIETAAASITVYFGCSVLNYTTVSPFEQTSIEGRLRFVPDNPVGNNLELLFWRCDLTPAGEIGMIADEWQVLEFTGEILKDETFHPSSPYGEILTSDVV